MRGREAVLFALALAVMLTMFISYADTNAPIYRPARANQNPSPHPVVFQPGSNANKNDIGPNNIIEVSTQGNGVALMLTVHPTYGTTYYKNVSIIVNTDNTNSYNLSFRLVNPADLPPGSAAKLCIFSANAPRSLIDFPNPQPGPANYIKLCIDLTGPRGEVNLNNPVKLNPGSFVEIDLLIHISGIVTKKSYKSELLMKVESASTRRP